MNPAFTPLPRRWTEKDFIRDGHDARAFCLQIIKEFYGIDYNPAWHADLDSLPLTGEDNWCWFPRGTEPVMAHNFH